MARNYEIESTIGDLERDVEKLESDSEKANERVGSIGEAMEKLAGDLAALGALARNKEDAEQEQREVRERADELRSDLSQLCSQLQAQMETLDADRSVLKGLEDIGEDMSEAMGILDKKQEWLEYCQEQMLRLGDRLDMALEAYELGDAGSSAVATYAKQLQEEPAEAKGDASGALAGADTESGVVGELASDFNINQDLWLGGGGEESSNKSNAIYSLDRVNRTKWFDSSEEADTALRKWAGKVWKSASEAQKDAINDYTGGSYFYNLSLNGYTSDYADPRNFAGVGNVSIDAHGYGDKIRNMTSYLQHSITEHDMWLRRGAHRSSLATFFGYPPDTDMTKLSEQELKGLIGTSGILGSFQSCGTTPKTGFIDEPVVIQFFVPAGSQAAYVEPFSRCGDGQGRGWDGDAPQDGFGPELETILQRGGSYTLIDFTYTNDKPTFVMEVHPEDGYRTFE